MSLPRQLSSLPDAFCSARTSDGLQSGVEFHLPSQKYFLPASTCQWQTPSRTLRSARSCSTSGRTSRRAFQSLLESPSRHAKTTFRTPDSSSLVPDVSCFPSLSFQLVKLIRSPFFFRFLACLFYFLLFFISQVFFTLAVPVRLPPVPQVGEGKYSCILLRSCSSGRSFQDSKTFGNSTVNVRSPSSSSGIFPLFLSASVEIVSPGQQLRRPLPFRDSLASLRCLASSLSSRPGTASQLPVFSSIRPVISFPHWSYLSTLPRQPATLDFISPILSVPLLCSRRSLSIDFPGLVSNTSAVPSLHCSKQNPPATQQAFFLCRSRYDASSTPSSGLLATHSPFGMQPHLRRETAISLNSVSFTRLHLLFCPAAKSRNYALKEKGQLHERIAGATRVSRLLRTLPQTSQQPATERKGNEAAVSAAVEMHFPVASGTPFGRHDSRNNETTAAIQNRNNTRSVETFSCSCLATKTTSRRNRNFTSNNSGHNTVSRAPSRDASLDSGYVHTESCLERAIYTRRPTAHSSYSCRSSSSFDTGSAEAKASAFRVLLNSHRCNRASTRICSSCRSRSFSAIGDSSNSGASNCDAEDSGRRSSNTPVSSSTSSRLQHGFESSHGDSYKYKDSNTRARTPDSGGQYEEISSCCSPALVNKVGNLRQKSFSKCCSSNSRDNIGVTNEKARGRNSSNSTSQGQESGRNSERNNSNDGRNSTIMKSNEGKRRDKEDIYEDESEYNTLWRGSESLFPVSARPTPLCYDLQQLQQSCCSAVSTTKQLLAAAWSHWKSLVSRREAASRLRCSGREYREEIAAGFHMQLLSATGRLRACPFAAAGGKSSWWTQNEQALLSLSEITQRAAALGLSTVDATATATACRAAAAAAQEAAVAAARFAKTAIQTAAESSVTAATTMARAVVTFTRATVGDSGKGSSWMLRWMLLLLPPPIPPVRQLLQGVLLLSFLADAFVFKGALLERLAFDMRRESLARSSNSGSDTREFSVRNSNRNSTSKKTGGGIFNTSLLSFCMRAAAAGLVHSNWLHLLVNLHGVRQLLPMCERLACDAVRSSKASEPNNAAGNLSAGVRRAAAAATVTSNDSFNKTWSWFWNPAAGGAAAAPTVISAATAAARQYISKTSAVAAAEEQSNCLGWLPELPVLHGMHGREGWWARAAVISLFAGGCAAGNITSFHLRRWWRRVELCMEQQQRQQKLKRKLWGGILPEAEACDDDGDDDDDTFSGESDSADAVDAASQQRHAAAAAAPGGSAAAGAGAVSSLDEGATSAAAALRGEDAASGARRESEAATAAFFRTFGVDRITGRAASSPRDEGDVRDGIGVGGTPAAAAAEGDDKGRLVQQEIHAKRRTEVVRREEKAWERQLRLQKMRETENRCWSGSGDSSSRAESGSRDGRGNMGAARKEWKTPVEKGRKGRSARLEEGGGAAEMHYDATEEEEKRIDEDLDEEILDETATVNDDRKWCVRTVGCSAGLYSLLGLLVGSARVGSTMKSSIVKQTLKKLLTEFFFPAGTDAPGHLGGFLFGYLAAHLLRW